MAFVSLIARVGFKAKGAMTGMRKFQGAARGMQKGITGVGQRTDQVMKSMNKNFKKVLAAGVGFFAAMVAASPALSAQMELLMWEISEIFRELGDLFVPIMEKIIEWVRKFVDWFKEKVIPVLEEWGRKFSEAWEKMKPALTEIWNKFKEVFQDYIKPMLERLGDTFWALFDTFAEVVAFIANLISGDWAAAFDNLGNIARNAIEGIGISFVNFLEWFYNWGERFKERFKEIFTTLGEWFHEWRHGKRETVVPVTDYFQDLFPDEPVFDPFRLPPPTGGGAGGGAGGGGGGAAAPPPVNYSFTFPIEQIVGERETELRSMIEKIMVILREKFELGSDW